jgi:hypothetical protein
MEPPCSCHVFLAETLSVLHKLYFRGSEHIEKSAQNSHKLSEMCVGSKYVFNKILRNKNITKDKLMIYI